MPLYNKNCSECPSVSRMEFLTDNTAKDFLKGFFLSLDVFAERVVQERLVVSAPPWFPLGS
jgi:hypothetical protein